ncbi:MAG: lipase maturation factor family protein, partial [Gammaproteobacteria bacterium]
MRLNPARLLEQDPDQQLTGWLFLKLLALIYFAAFFSLSVQINGLAGPGGILPFAELLQNAEQSLGTPSAWLRLPTLFWIDAGDTALQGATMLGMLFSMMLFFNWRPVLSLVLLFVLYLSLFHAGQIFLSFQWDFLLMETGLLAIFIVKGPSRLMIFMFHWLLFRLRFLSGASKLLSGDPSWSGMTALDYYFETQPLPHAGAWYAHQLPEWVLHAGVGVTFFAELVVPFFIFLPRRFRLFAAGFTIAIQLLIIAT